MVSAVTAGVVLAGGRSSRMGTAKAALEWHGSTLLRRTLGVLSRAVEGPLLVVRAPGQVLPAVPPQVHVIDDPQEGLGPLQGIAAGLGALAGGVAGLGAAATFVCATDLPFLHPLFIRRVLDALTEDTDVVLPVARGYPQPLAAAYRVSLAPLAAELVAAGDLRPAFLLRHPRCRTVRLDDAALLADSALAAVDPALDSVININSPREYRTARNHPAPEIRVRCPAPPAGHRDQQARTVRAATVAGAATAVGLTLDRRVAATLNGERISRAGDVPLTTGDILTFHRDGSVPAVPPHTPRVSGVPAAQARLLWREACVAAGCPQQVGIERLGLAEAIGRVVAEPVWARRSSPAFDSAGMDGVAVRAADTVGASETAPLTLTDFDVVDTGDPLPPGRDAVVMRERVRPVEQGVQVSAAAAPYHHVRSIGEDLAAGELLLAPGHRLRGVDVGALAAAGVVEVVVRRRPVVAVLPTGDEIRPLGTEPGLGEIPDTNSLMLAGQAGEHGCDALTLPIEPDDPQRIAAALRDAAERADLVVLIAGASAGRDDHSASALALVGTLAVHGVAVRPGHPMVLGTVGTTPVLGAPGYPVSAALTFEIFAGPLLAALQGTTAPTRPVTRARLARPLASPGGMQDWVRVRLARIGGQLVATPLHRGAGVLTSLVRADGLLVVPAGRESYPAGADVEVQLLRGLTEIDRTIVAAGSHDLLLDLAAAALRNIDPGLTLASSPVGSLAGLTALRDGLCHLAGSPLLDPDTGRYTLSLLSTVLGDTDVAVVRLAHREQGLIVAAGNPLGLTGIEDLGRPGLRYVNRQHGAGTRALLDHELRRHGMTPSDVTGYERQERTHLAVAAAVAADRADAGLGIMAAARAFGLGFVPLVQEPFDLVLTRATHDSALLTPLWELLADEKFHAAAEALGGYCCAETGTRVR